MPTPIARQLLEHPLCTIQDGSLHELPPDTESGALISSADYEDWFTQSELHQPIWSSTLSDYVGRNTPFNVKFYD